MKLGIILICLMLLAIIAGGFYILNQPKDTKISDPGQSTEKIIIGDSETLQKVASEGSTLSSPESGTYQVYSESAFDGLDNERRVLFFFANWCPICKPADAEFTSNISKLPKDLNIFRVNYNDSETDEAEKALAQKYGITYQHTFVQIDKDGNEITKWNGGGLEKLLSLIK